MNRIFLLLAVTVSLYSCNDNETERCAERPDNVPYVEVNFVDLRDSMLNIESKTLLTTLLSRHQEVRDYTFRRNEYPNDSAFINQLFERFRHPSFDTLAMETERVFGDLTNLKNQFSEAFANIKAYYPDFKPPVVKAVISGLDSDLLVSDSIIVVSLDFYLGDGAKYRPRIYDYLLRRYGPEDIVPSCMLMLGISERFNKSNLSDKTVLADMVAYGKSFYFAKRALPCVPDSVFLWYTSEEMRGSRKNEDMIWARLIEDKVIYSTSMVDKRNYLGERPFTIQVGEKCPGRIAQWVGWRIVDAYMETHPNTTLPELMQISDAQMLFRESKYKPQRR